MDTSTHRIAIESSDRPLAFEIVVLDLDGTMTQQTRLLQRYRPKVIPLQQRHAELRHSCPSDTMDSLRAYVASQVDLQKPRIALYGTGNSHHLASLWISLLDEPVTVIGFDRVSNCVRTISGYCWLGSWAVLAANLPHVQKLVLLGCDRYFALALHHEADGIAMQSDGSVMTSATWKAFDRSDVEVGMECLLSNLSTHAVHITINKNGLQRRDACCNVHSSQPSQQETLTLDAMLETLSLIKQHKRIVGVDIGGDYPALVRSSASLKPASSNWQLKAASTKRTDLMTPQRTNEDVNLRILETLLGK